jgi:ABC-type nitrate/sulfonate/bicarbonate transport system ATPase subunit
MRAAITVKNLNKRFGSFTVIDNLNLDIEAGLITAILAPSGAGKTTLLRLISGLEKPTSGIITLNGEKILEPNPEIGFMFQESSAFPWLTLRKNIVFGLKLRANKGKVDKKEIADRVIRICKELNIDKFLDSYPSQLSGGQKQRVVIARSLILKPKVILCDEPFSALDEITRNDLRELLLELHRHYSPTIIFITHSVEEAVFLGDQLIICSGPPLKRVEEMKISLPIPRTSSLLDAAAFIEQRTKAKRILLEISQTKGEQ